MWYAVYTCSTLVQFFLRPTLLVLQSKDVNAWTLCNLWTCICVAESSWHLTTSKKPIQIDLWGPRYFLEMDGFTGRPYGIYATDEPLLTGLILVSIFGMDPWWSMSFAWYLQTCFWRCLENSLLGWMFSVYFVEGNLQRIEHRRSTSTQTLLHCYIIFGGDFERIDFHSV